MKKACNLLKLLLLVAFCFNLKLHAKGGYPYQNAKLPTTQRVADLLRRMTLDEKIGQLRCLLGWEDYTLNGHQVYPSEKFKKELTDGHIGMLWATFRADPWTKKSLANGLTPVLAAQTANALQRYAIENTRLGIPLLFAEEAPHGHMAIGTTVFPTGLGLAATWSTDIAEAIGKVIARQIRQQGAHVSFGPVLDITRDPRWSRVEESMGEDPVLTANMGAAMVKGLGGGQHSQPNATIPTLKHFVGYGTTEGGQNGCQTMGGLRDVRQNFFLPFQKAIEAGATAIMTSYNSLDGVPSTANPWLYTDVLRRQWKFNGLVISDLYSIDGLWHTHHVAHTLTEAAALALNAGVDIDLGGRAYQNLAKAVAKGWVKESTIDSACARVLQKKFEMGLFEHPFVPVNAAKNINYAADKAVALKAAQQAITLLKNESHILPLNKNYKIALVGPNANNIYNQLGDYTAPQSETNIKTVLMGLQTKIPTQQIRYVQGCAIRDTTNSTIDEAVAAAKWADVVVAVVGGSSARDFKTQYQATGAAETNARQMSDMESGEGYDRATLSLLGRQEELLAAMKQTGKPLVICYIEGRPLLKNWAAQHANALLTAYYPGQEGGQAIADALFGDINPAGRLPISVPAHVGQLPCYYNKRLPAPHDYVEMSAAPQYAFGYGLSYTTFRYANLNVEQRGSNRFHITFEVSNTGDRNGEEVAQLYLHDQVASVVQPMLQLKHFARIFIPKGATKQVAFDLLPTDFTFIGADMQPTLEPRSIDIGIGSASNNLLLRTTIHTE
ncbi:glycoside hydrolase family 3 N-terminal domain-containing protein [Segatella oulorum]|uniref:glycoside hydrolase family 3 N-terminal domain-containing protein n=1 Tax=Segatella oulorum TaxID=28136 RepID=UPI0028EBFE9F|nr:glycoside hydrolase family 3 N-terminal domain-containing protein [Segatella oulorum]